MECPLVAPGPIFTQTPTVNLKHNHHQIDEREDDECFHRKSGFWFNIVIWWVLPQPSEVRISLQIFGESTESQDFISLPPDDQDKDGKHKIKFEAFLLCVSSCVCILKVPAQKEA